MGGSMDQGGYRALIPASGDDVWALAVLSIMFVVGVASIWFIRRVVLASRAAAREQRDALARHAIANPIPMGTRLADVPGDHPWRRSVDARLRAYRSRASGVIIAGNPFWRDSPVMNQTLWAVATGPEEHFVSNCSRARSESRGRFDKWLHHISVNDRQLYFAYLQWEQQERLIAEQRRAAAAAEAAQRAVIVATHQAAAQAARAADAAERTARATQQAELNTRWSAYMQQQEHLYEFGNRVQRPNG